MAKLPVDPNFAVQLAMQVPISKMPLPAAGQIKYNGCRIVTEIDIWPVFKTRNSHQVKYPEMANALNGFPGGYIIDGEWCRGDSKGTNHTTVSGLINSAMKTGQCIPNGLGWEYHIFDAMPLRDFKAQQCHMTYEERWKLVNQLCRFNISPLVKPAKTWHFTSHAAIEEKFNELLGLGYEGMIIKAWNSKYTFKKNKTWMKLKNEDTADLLCVGWEEGKGKYQGMIGKLICHGSINGKIIDVSVGTGLTDADRALSPDEYLGKTIEVKYNEICKDLSTGQYSLFLPVFIIVREDKS